MKEYQRIYLSMPNSELKRLFQSTFTVIFIVIFLKDRMISGMTYEQIARKTKLFSQTN